MFYKVVTDDLKSAVMQAESGLQTQYKVDEWVSADQQALKAGYGLCVFSTLENAKTFAFTNSGGGLKIFECEIKELENPAKYRHYIDSASLDSIINSADNPRVVWPDSTVLVSAVKLTKEKEID